MFFHQFKCSLKVLFKNKPLVFWTYIFPILLAFFFNMAFSNITSDETFDAFDVAIVDDSNFRSNEALVEAFKTLSEGEDKIFNISYVDLDEAKNLLEDKKVVGYLEMVNNEPSLKFKTNGVNQTIFKTVVAEVMQTSNLMSDLSSNYVQAEISSGNYIIDYNKIRDKVEEVVSSEYKLNDISSSKLDYAVVEFYTLIAMTCLYGGMLGMFSMNNCLANMSDKGKRVAVSPAKKMSLVLSSLLSGYLVQLIGLSLLFVFLIFILGVDFGNRTGLVVLTGIVGSFAGLSLGLGVGSIFKCSRDSKLGIIIAYTMFCTFFAGMFGMTMKYIVDTNFPIFNMVNPSSLITDALYSLYYYTSMNRFWTDIFSLLIYSLILIVASMAFLRRQKYDSI